MVYTVNIFKGAKGKECNSEADDAQAAHGWNLSFLKANMCPHYGCEDMDANLKSHPHASRALHRPPTTHQCELEGHAHK